MNSDLRPGSADLHETVDLFEVDEDDLSRSDASDSGEASKPASDPFARVPYSVVRDRKLSPPAIVLLTYRLTIATTRKRYGLNAVAIARKFKIGKNRAKAVIAELREYGLLDRAVRVDSSGKAIGGNGRHDNGKWRYATDEPTTKATWCGESGRAGIHVRQSWLTAHEIEYVAAWMVVRAGTGKGKTFLRRDLAQRFGWKKVKVRKVLAYLSLHGLVRKTTRDELGQYKENSFKALPFRAHQSTLGAAHGGGLDVCVSGEGYPVTDFRSTVARSTVEGATHEPSILHELPTGGPQPRTQRDSYTFRTACGKALTFAEISEDDLRRFEHEARNNALLLGWVLKDDHEGEFATDILDRMIEEPAGEQAYKLLLKAVQIDVAIDAIRATTDGNVNSTIASPAGALALVMFAAFLVGADPNLRPDTAFIDVLKAISDRIASKPGSWLNSLALVGNRIIRQTAKGDAEMRADGRFYGPEHDEALTIAVPAVPAEAQMGATAPVSVLAHVMAKIHEVDINKLIWGDLYSRNSLKADLRVLIYDFGADFVIEVAREKITGMIIDGAARASIKAWDFFRGPCTDRAEAEMRLAQVPF